MADAGSAFGICEACHAPRSEQDMICARCGYVFKTKPVPAFPSEPPHATRRTDPPTIAEPPAAFVQTAPIEGAMRSPNAGAGASGDEAPRTLHSPSAPPVGDRPVVPVGTWSPPRPATLPRPTEAAPRPAWLPWAAAALVIIAIAAIVGAVSYTRTRAIPLAATPRISWDASTPLAFGALGADKTAGFVGRYLETGIGASAFYVGAFAAADRRELWRAGPFDTTGAPAPLPSAIVAAHVLLGDARAVLHVYDAATGHETHVVELGDRATRITPNADKEAFIEVANGANVLFDVPLGKAKISPPPPWAPPRAGGPPCPFAPASRSLCLDASRVKAANFTVIRAIAAGDLGVAFGHEPTSRAPLLLAFTVATGAERWRAPVTGGALSASSDAAPFDIDGALVIVTSGEGAAPHVTAFAASSGGRAWDTALPATRVAAAPRMITGMDGRVYVTRASRLDVLDHATGALVGGIGLL